MTKTALEQAIVEAEAGVKVKVNTATPGTGTVTFLPGVRKPTSERAR